MTIAMAGLTPEVAFIYIDDIIVIGCSMRHHIKNLTTVFERLRHYNLKLNPSKCKFFKSEVTYLGHKVTDKGILPDDSKYESLVKYPVPQNADEVRRFVAFCNYYRKFVENFSTIAHPLNQLCKKNCKFDWSVQCQLAFDTLKHKLLSPKILQYPDFAKTFILTTDASNVGCGAILSQITSEGDRPIAYASRTFTPGEKNKSVILKELTAIHWAINYFKPYLYGNRFVIRTDHRPLVHLYGMKDPTSKLTQMRLDLGEFNFDVIYIAGKENVGADALSRIVITSEQLQNMQMLVVNTRSMQKTKSMQSTQVDTSITYQAAYTVENINETRKLCALRVVNNTLQIYKNKKIMMKIPFQPENERPTLEMTLSRLEKELKKMRIDRISLSTEDEIFKKVTTSTFKIVANKTLQSLQILIYKPPMYVDNKNKIQEILRNFHNTPTGGHVGQTKMYLQIRDLYRWKAMKRSITLFVQACELCKRNKIVQHTKEPQIITTTPSKPFEIITIDTVGPLPKTNNGNRYAITIQCELTKYIVLAPIQNKEANTIARAIVDNFILIYGKFLEIKTDQGTEYNNEVLSQICKQLKIKQTFATAYHPQTIGALERNHRCLNEYLRCFVNEHQSDWDDWLKYYQFNYNTTPHTIHGYTPYELVFGVKANLPHSNNQRNLDPVYNLEAYHNELKFRLQKSQNLTKSILEQQKQEKTQICNKIINPIHIQIGDLVYLKKENRRKLDSFYQGPFRITQIRDPNCELEEPITKKKTIVHKNRIIK